MARTSLLSALLPAWLGWVMVVVFAIIAVSHLRHMLQTAGQRRPWHACHVLVALSMLCMYAPGASSSSALALAWRAVLAAACVLAALWMLSGSAGSPNPLWLATVLDLAVMIWMWSADAPERAIAWLAVVYLTAASLIWIGDLARQVDHRRLGLAHLLPSADRGGQVAFRGWLSAVRPRGATLLGEVDITSSMSLMAAAMAYMVVVMHLA